MSLLRILRFDAKQGERTSLMEAGYGQNFERIHGVKKEINEPLHHEEVFGRQRYPSGCRQGIQNFSIKGRASDEERTTLGDCMIGKESGTPNEDKIANIAEAYYKQLFTSSTSLDMNAVIESVDRVVTEGMA